MGLGAQNLNPEVQVTNEYETQLNDVVKQGPNMTVPDSMLRFDYHFDYSVFDSPYKGSYEFTPYSVSITPTAGGYDGRKLYLRAGAGWVLKPELDFVWSALDGKKAAVGVFAKGNGFYGKYLGVAPDTFISDKSVLYNGFDFGTTAGVDTRFNIGKSVLRAEIGYDGIFTGHEKDHGMTGHAPYALVRMGSNSAADFSYNASVLYRYVNDYKEGWGKAEDHEVRVEVGLSPYHNEKTGIALDLLYAYNKWYMGASLKPHLFYSTRNWDFDAGFRVGWHTEPDQGKFNICPDVRATLHLLNRQLDVYAGAVGQEHLPGYWDYKTRAHRYFLTYAEPEPYREIADLFLGVKGFTGFGLKGDLKAGYIFLEHAPFWAVSADGRETLLFQDCGLLHADLDLAWSSQRIDTEASVHYKWLPEGVGDRVFEPAAVTAHAMFQYNWMKRIYAGISGDMSTARKATVGDNVVEMPWYIDLGIFAGYKLNSKVGFWLKGTNLLNQEIRQSPVYCQYGPSVIAGVTLSL
jgi:hypothetical protein